MDTEKKIKKRMAELDILIKEVRDRVPAHSAKPGIMIELMSLEDEYEDLLNRLDALKKRTD